MDRNFSAVDGSVHRGLRSWWPRGCAVNQYNFATAHGGGRWLPRSHPPHGSSAVFLHEITSHRHLNNYTVVDGVGTGWSTRFQPRESAPIFIDQVCIVDFMDHQFPTVDGGAVRGPEFSGGVSYTSPAIPYGYEHYLPIQSLDSGDDNQDSRVTEVDNEGGLSEEVIARKLKTRMFDQTTTNDEDYRKICVVCQDNVVKENKTMGILRCGHEYHACCIKTWLQHKNLCPLCKAIAL